MRVYRNVCVLLLVFVTNTMLVATTDAQERSRRNLQQRRNTQTRRARSVDDEIPKAALLTDRGTELATRLRFLRLSEQTMGAKHPSLESVRKEIEDVKTELAVWIASSRRMLTASDSDSDGDENDTPAADVLPEMNDRDVRQLILSLVGKIRQLESRIKALEDRVPARRPTPRTSVRQSQESPQQTVASRPETSTQRSRAATVQRARSVRRTQARR